MSEPAVRAGDADRDAAVAALRDHLVAGRLTLDEFVERAEAAHEARTLVELEELQRDLPATAAGTAPSLGAAARVAARRKPVRWAVAVMSASEKRGRWRAPERIKALACMGAVVIDLREAELESDHIVIEAFALMGSVEVVVPEGVDVELTGVAVMGAKESRVLQAPVPGAPFVHVRALAVMGAVEVRSKRGRRRGLPGPPPLPPLPPRL